MADEETIKLEGFGVKIRQEDGVFIARVLELPGCVDQGNTREEAIKNITKAMYAYLCAIARDTAMKRKGCKVVPIAAAKRKTKGRAPER